MEKQITYFNLYKNLNGKSLLSTYKIKFKNLYHKSKNFANYSFLFWLKNMKKKFKRNEQNNIIFNSY